MPVLAMALGHIEGQEMSCNLSEYSGYKSDALALSQTLPIVQL